MNPWGLMRSPGEYREEERKRELRIEPWGALSIESRTSSFSCKGDKKGIGLTGQKRIPIEQHQENPGRRESAARSGRDERCQVR